LVNYILQINHASSESRCARF